MAEQQNDALLARSDSADTVIQVRSDTSNGSTAHALKVAGITMLVCMLVAGQGLSVYYVVSQHGQIKDMEYTAHNLKMQMSRRPSGSSPAQVVRMPMYSMPLLMDMKDDGNKKIPMTKLENTAVVSVEKQVKDLLQDQEFPQFNETFLDNLKALKSQMEESQWKGFESWMYQWLLFQMAQHAPQKPTPAPVEQTTSLEASQIKTKCVLENEGHGGVKPGFYRPQCDGQGNYLPMQCWYGTGYCWCVDNNGQEIPNTRIRGRPSCGGGMGFKRMMAMPAFSRMMEVKND